MTSAVVLPQQAHAVFLLKVRTGWLPARGPPMWAESLASLHAALHRLPHQDLVRLASALAHLQAEVLSMVSLAGSLDSGSRLGPAPCERLLTMPEAATLLALPEYTAREMGRTGELATVHFGRDVRVRLATIETLIRERESRGLHPGASGEVRPRLPQQR